MLLETEAWAHPQLGFLPHPDIPLGTEPGLSLPLNTPRTSLSSIPHIASLFLLLQLPLSWDHSPQWGSTHFPSKPVLMERLV